MSCIRPQHEWQHSAHLVVTALIVIEAEDHLPSRARMRSVGQPQTTANTSTYITHNFLRSKIQPQNLHLSVLRADSAKGLPEGWKAFFEPRYCSPTVGMRTTSQAKYCSTHVITYTSTPERFSLCLADPQETKTHSMV